MLVQKYLNAALGVVAEKIDRDLCGVYADFTSQTNGSHLTDDLIKQARKNFNKLNVLHDGRSLVVSPDVYSSDLLNKTINPEYNLWTSMGSDMAVKALTQGSLGVVREFAVLECNQVNETDGSPNVHHILALGQNGIAVQWLQRDLVNEPAVREIQITYQGMTAILTSQYSIDDEKFKYIISVLYAVGVMDQRQCQALNINGS
jgi:hypothetical protein